MYDTLQVFKDTQLLSYNTHKQYEHFYAAFWYGSCSEHDVAAGYDLYSRADRQAWAEQQVP